MKSTTFKIDRWLDNNAKKNGIENGTNWQRDVEKDSESICAASTKIDQVKLVKKFNSRIAVVPATKVENETSASDANSSNGSSSVDLPTKKFRFNDNQPSKVQPLYGNAPSSAGIQAQLPKLPRTEGDDW